MATVLSLYLLYSHGSICANLLLWLGSQWLEELGNLGNESLGIPAHEIGQHNDGQPIIGINNKRSAVASDARNLPMWVCSQHWPTSCPIAIRAVVQLFWRPHAPHTCRTDESAAR